MMTGAVMSPGWILDTLGLTVRAPALAAQRLLSLGLPRPVLFELLILVTAVSVLIVGLSPAPMILADASSGEAGRLVVLPPLVYAVLLCASLLMMSAGLKVAGTALGGRGGFDASLTLVIWVEVVATMFRVVQMGLMLLVPPLAGLVSVIGLVVLIWTLLHFIKVLHGFPGLGRALGTLLIAVAGISFGIAVILMAITGGSGGGAIDV
jgi:hypothetical protein